MEINGFEVPVDADGSFTEETLENVRLLIYHPGWVNFYVPILYAAREAAVQALLNPSWDRKGAHPDDYLRAKVHVLDMVLGFGPAVAEEDANRRIAEAEAARNDQGYQERADLGRTGPLS
jgi:hypothetical protein